MKYLVTMSIRENADFNAVGEARIPSSKAAWALYLNGTLTDMYARQDGKGVVFIAEAPDIVTIGKTIGEIPLVKTGQVVGDIIGLAPFADLSLAFTG